MQHLEDVLNQEPEDYALPTYDLGAVHRAFVRRDSLGSHKKPIHFTPGMNPYELAAIDGADLTVTNETHYGKKAGLIDRFFSRMQFGPRVAEPETAVFMDELVDTDKTQATLHLSYTASAPLALFVPHGINSLDSNDGQYVFEEDTHTVQGSVGELAQAFMHFPRDFSIAPDSVVHKQRRHRIHLGNTNVLRLHVDAHERVADAPIIHRYEHVLAVTYTRMHDE